MVQFQIRKIWDCSKIFAPEKKTMLGRYDAENLVYVSDGQKIWGACHILQDEKINSM